MADRADFQVQGSDLADSEPPDVREARAVLKRWKLRNGHSSYVECLGGGSRGYQARCWDCEWRGPEHLRGDEPMGTPESRAHKIEARREAWQHQKETTPEDWRTAKLQPLGSS